MSSEHQQYSLENQSTAIRRYAESHGFEVVQTYSDGARSGLGLKRRTGLRQLVQDVVGGIAPYKVILVYDVSRWGRFQDTDESAHYEFLCKSAGVPVHYCAESFVNDGSLPSAIMKALKRVMAGEYSRELGVKVAAGQKRLAELGFWQGGPAGYGFRRVLVSPEGRIKQSLTKGERKSIATDRVVLVPGPTHEVEQVQDIFRLFTIKKMGARAIALDLNRRGIPSPKNTQWSHSVVATILSHPRYVGCNVFNQTTKRLGGPWIARPRTEWVIIPGAFEGIVDPKMFAVAQTILSNLTARKTDEQILRELRSLLDSKGKLNPEIIDDAPGMACTRTLWRRFGSVRKAYELIGHK
jgi:DNA invertase Pin-like site-specific DNA recombinase